jgi:hypothetical protein
MNTTSKLPPEAVAAGRVACPHCGSAPVLPRPRRSHGPVHWLLLLAAVVAGYVVSPWLYLFAAVPVLIPAVHHVCPICRLRLD